MSHKSKGINAERELIHLFHKHGWSAVRVAGSGSSKYPSPDIVAGNIIRKLAVECKSVKEPSVYVAKEDIEKLKIFAKNFGAEPWLAAKFQGNEWFFMSLDDLKETDSNFSINIELGKQKGLLFEEVIGKL